MMISVTIKVAEHKDVVSFAARTCDDSFLYFYPFSSILTSQEPKDWKGSWLLGRQPQVHGWDKNDDDDDNDYEDEDDHNLNSSRIPKNAPTCNYWHLAIMQGTAFRG